jgi:hypothetical protein
VEHGHKQDDPSAPSGLNSRGVVVSSSLARRGAGLWPSQMGLTTDLTVLGLTEEDLASEEREEKKIRERNLKERRSIKFGEAEVDGGSETHLEEVARALADAFGSTAFKSRSGPARLQPFVGGDRQPSRPGGRSGSGKEDPVYLSEEQRTLLGFAGELAAYHYLKLTARGFADEHWVSSLGRRYLGLAPKQDDDGFDFRIPRSRGALHYEVKAHTGDPGYVDLERSQIAAAASMASERGGRWRILYINYVRTPSLISVHELPNPFSREGAVFFRESQRQGARLLIQRLA